MARGRTGFAAGQGGITGLPTASIGNVSHEFLQPGVGMRVARRSPIASRRERTAGSDLWRVRKPGALELARLEEATEEDREPPRNRRPIVPVLIRVR